MASNARIGPHRVLPRRTRLTLDLFCPDLPYEMKRIKPFGFEVECVKI